MNESLRGGEERSDDAPADTSGIVPKLLPVLDRHRQWVASGWETGKRADLHGSDLNTANLSGVLLADADLHRADLHYALLAGADLEGADLHRADLHEADMRDTDLQWADLHDSDLHGANLRRAMLKEADLHRADLHAADLTDAQLGGADLRDADLRGVRGLTRAQIETATTNSGTLLPPSLRI